jgi:selenocysteine lyase/cysteine desulfurase
MHEPDAPEKSSDLRERCLRLREKEFPWTADTTYFNNAGIGPIPERTRLVLDELNALKAAPQTIDVPSLFKRLAKTRRTVARILNADVDEIALTTSTTMGLNVAAQAVPVQAGEVVLVSDKEFPANVYPWKQLESRGVVVELAPTLPNGWPDEAYLCERVSDPEVRVLAISLIQFSNGHRSNIERLGEACRAGNCFFVVDGIQGIGQIAFDVQATPVDMIACGGQKWLLSPFGSGFLYVRRELVEQFEPTFVGWLAFEGTEDFTRLTEYEYTLLRNARRFEINTLPFQDLIAMGESLELLLEFGTDSIEEWLREVRRPLLAELRYGRLRAVSPLDEKHQSGIVCVEPGRLTECQEAFAAEGVVVALREGAIRLSPHCYNTPEEMEKAAAILMEYA